MKFFISVFFFAILFTGYGQKLPLLNLDDDNLAAKGFDLVTYFDGIPQKGKESISTNYKGVTYYFITERNKEQFQKSPNNYLPQYGGWCAYAMGDSGEKVSVDPETYKIIDGKLYLFYNKFFTNTLNYWNEDETALKKKADSNWLENIHQ